jgi:hypothetical protein
MRVYHCVLAALPALALSGCGPGDLFGTPRDAFAPLCPNPQLIPTLADLTRYAGPGPGHDITDMIVQARVTAVNGSCKPGDRRDQLDTSVRISVAVQRGPAMRGRDTDLPVFLAVARGQDVEDKQVFPVHVSFPPNVERVTLTSPPVTLTLPVGPKLTGASYTLIAGFQLTPDELSANRQRGR